MSEPVVRNDLHYIKNALMSGGDINKADMLTRIRRIERYIETLERNAAKCPTQR